MANWSSNEWLDIDNVTILCYTEQEANDNGITIPAGCLPSCTIDIDDVATTEPSCGNSTDGDITIDVTSSGLSGSLEYSIDNGNSFQSSNFFPNLGPGTYDIIVQDDNDSGCQASSSVTLSAISNIPNPNPPPPLQVCYSFAPLGFDVINLTEVEDALTNFDPGLDVTLYFDAAATDDIDVTDPNDINTFIALLPTTIYATISDGTCESGTVPVSLQLAQNPPSPSDGMLTGCGNGNVTFDLTDADGQFDSGGSLTVTYHSSQPDAQDGVNPITMVTTSSSTSVVVRLENSNGCPAFALLNLVLGNGPTIDDATLAGCDNGSGEATFDLTEAENDIRNGQSGIITFYEDIGLNNPIGDPTDYTSFADEVYAVLDDGSGCPSAPATVTLDIITIDTDQIGLSFSPESGCGLTPVDVILNAPPVPAGDFTFVVSYFPESGGVSSTLSLVGQDGDSNFTLNIDEPTVFQLSMVTSSGPSFCEVIFDPPLEYLIDINAAPDAVPAEVTACADAFGDGTFDLTEAESTINDGSGLPVIFYEDIGLNSEITNPTNYVSSATTIYAVVDGGGSCTSATVEVDLLLDEPPSPFNIFLTPEESCGPTDVTIDFQLPGGELFDVDVTYTNSSGSTTVTFPNFGDFSTIVEFISETTTFSISSITNEQGCTFPVDPPLTETIIIGGGITASEPPPLSGCENLAGNVVFDLTETENDILGGQSGTVIFYEDSGASIEITNPFSYTSPAGVVYALIDDGSGCTSSPVEVNLVTLPRPDGFITIINPISCAGAADGEIELTITTGGGPFELNWNLPQFAGQTILTDLSALDYDVQIVGANGCTGEADVLLTDPQSLNLDCPLNVTPESTIGAADGEVDFDISGGTAPYTIELIGPTATVNPGQPAGFYTYNNLAAGNYTLTILDENGCFTDCAFTIPEGSCNLNATLMASDPDCNDSNDGSIIVDITSGAGGYTYDWSDDQYDGQNIIGNLPPGTYELTITDMAGCERPLSEVLMPPPALNLACNANGEGEGNGPNSYSFTYSGGTPFYVLELDGPTSTTFTQNTPGVYDTGVLPEGNYTFTLTDENGCNESCTFLIEPICDLALAPIETDPLCANTATGAIDLMATSSQAIFVFDWSDDDLDGQAAPTGLTAGTYAVTVIDATGCTETESVTLSATGSNITIDCSQVSNPSNPAGTDGGVDVVFAGGTGPYTITWSGTVSGSETVSTAGTFQITPLSVGPYTVTITDANGCSETCNFVITNDENCNFTFSISSTAESCAGAMDGTVSFSLIEGQTDYTFLWSDPSFNTTASSTGFITFDNFPAGNYAVTVVDASNCVDEGMIEVAGFPPIEYACEVGNDPSSTIATDGSINIVFNDPGDTGPYNIFYDNGAGVNGIIPAMEGNNVIENLPVGTYTIELSNGVCTEPCSVTLSSNSCTFGLTLFPQAETCVGANDGSGTLVASGGEAPYTYLWSTDDTTAQVTNLAPGNYSATVTDGNGCIALASGEVMAGSPLPTVVLPADTSICHDDCIDLEFNVAGTPDFTIQYTLFSGGISLTDRFTTTDNPINRLLCTADLGLAAGEIVLIVDSLFDANCFSLPMDTLLIDYQAPLRDTLLATICSGDTLTVNGTDFSASNLSGEVVFTGATPADCDTLRHVEIQFFPTNETNQTFTVCQGDTLFLQGQAFHANNTTGTVIFAGEDANGCDSIVNVTLVEQQAVLEDVTPSLCIGDSLLIAGQWFSNLNQ
ncbi:MAG: SprB repeat-containing protein, partial [Bacteroidota bacterium]